MKVKLDDSTMRHLKHLVRAVLEQEDNYIRDEMGTDEEHDRNVILDDETLAARAEAHPGGSDILWLHAYRVFRLDFCLSKGINHKAPIRTPQERRELQNLEIHGFDAA
jgi:hypothetical protein